jgi:hypothetical protein
MRLEVSRPHLLTVAEYMSADIQGRTELLGGVIYDVSPRNEPHRYAVRVLTRLLILDSAPATRYRPKMPLRLPGARQRCAGSRRRRSCG